MNFDGLCAEAQSNMSQGDLSSWIWKVAEMKYKIPYITPVHAKNAGWVPDCSIQLDAWKFE